VYGSNGYVPGLEGIMYKKCPWCGDLLVDHSKDDEGFLICPINDNDDAPMSNAPDGIAYDIWGYPVGTTEDEL
jgi:hypothetical protein